MGKNVKGVLGEKLGMTQVWDDANRVVPVTVIKAGPCVVTQVRSPEVDGYSAVQLGYGAIEPRKVNKPDAGHFAKAGAAPKRYLVELRTDDASEYTLGQEVGPWRECFSRCSPQSPQARFNRCLRHARSCLPWNADGRSRWQRAQDGPEPADSRD